MNFGEYWESLRTHKYFHLKDQHDVGLTKEHPLYNWHYSKHLPVEKWSDLENSKELFKGSPIDLMIAACEIKEKQNGPQISYFLNVHGGITYSSGSDDYPIKSENTWWFGFDCAHLDDTPEKCSEAYVTEECEYLSRQLADYAVSQPLTNSTERV